MATSTELLNLDGVASRTEGARFELRDASGGVLGSITPTRIVSIDNRADGVLKRTVPQFVLAPSVAADINPLTDRVWPYWLLGDGSQYPLGQFLFATWSAQRTSYGLTASARLLDQGLILGQPIRYSFGVTRGTQVRDALAQLFDAAGIHTYNIDPSNGASVDNALAWPAGSSTTYAAIATQLCTLGGMTDWFFDNSGVCTVLRTPNLNNAATLLYDSGGRIIAGSAVEQADLLNSPNVYVAVDTANRAAPIVGTYTLPNSAPHSIANRGFAITKTIEAPGVGSSARAEQFAAAYAQSDPDTYQTVTFSGPPDPRHDTYDVIGYLGTNYQETAWRLRCAPGGPHEHTLTRAVYL